MEFQDFKLLFQKESLFSRLPPAIHVAGTNGKTSTVWMISHILSHLGFRVGTYTSPHLVHKNERIVMNGRPLSDALLNAYLSSIDSLAGAETMGYFQRMTYAAFLAFSIAPLDFIVVETGIGGRLDSTNVLTQTCLSVITKIGYDHQKKLGNTIEEIALEKSGIIKPHVPLLTFHQSRNILNVLEGECIKKSSSLVTVAGEDKVDYIQQNRLLAKSAVKLLLPQVSNAQLEAGCHHFKPAGRLQCVFRSKKVDVWIDGAHNPDAAEALAKYFSVTQNARRLFLIFGQRKGRQASLFLDHFRGLASQFMSVDFYDESALGADTLCDAWGGASEKGQNWGDVWGKCARSLKTSKDPYTILITGSLYLVGHFLKHHDQHIKVLQSLDFD